MSKTKIYLTEDVERMIKTRRVWIVVVRHAGLVMIERVQALGSSEATAAVRAYYALAYKGTSYENEPVEILTASMESLHQTKDARRYVRRTGRHGRFEAIR